MVKEAANFLFAVDIIVDDKTLLILTGQQAHSRGHVDWSRHVGIGEECSLLRGAIDIWGGDLRLPKFRQIGTPHVIGENQDDVWASPRRLPRPRRAERRSCPAA